MTRKQLELENARLRGQVEALEKLVEAYRILLTPWCPYLPALSIPVAPTIPAPMVINPHGGFCACSQCMPPWTIT